MLRRLLDHDEAFAPGDVARMLNQLAYSLYVLNEFDAALEHAERAVEVASAAATARSSSTRCRRCPGRSTGSVAPATPARHHSEPSTSSAPATTMFAWPGR